MLELGLCCLFHCSQCGDKIFVLRCCLWIQTMKCNQCKSNIEGKRGCMSGRGSILVTRCPHTSMRWHTNNALFVLLLITTTATVYLHVERITARASTPSLACSVIGSNTDVDDQHVLFCCSLSTHNRFRLVAVPMVVSRESTLMSFWVRKIDERSNRSD